MEAWTPSEGAAVAAVAIAGVQLLASRWRDLGVVSLAACGVALTLSRGAPEAFVGGLVLLAVVLAALSWARGARRGVGRPGLDGLGLAVGALSWGIPVLLRYRVPASLAERLVEGGVVLCGLTAALGLTLALERPGPRRRRPRFFRRVPVVEQPPSARGEHDAPGPATGPSDEAATEA